MRNFRNLRDFFGQENLIYIQLFKLRINKIFSFNKVFALLNAWSNDNILRVCVFLFCRYEPPIDDVHQLSKSNLEWGATHDAWVFSILNAEGVCNNIVFINFKFDLAVFIRAQPRMRVWLRLCLFHSLCLCRAFTVAQETVCRLCLLRIK